MDDATRPEQAASAGAGAGAVEPNDERAAPAELQTRLAELSDWRLIGRGGFAAVYAARQTRLGRTVAVKLLNDRPSPHALRGFMRECELLGRLSSHPNIVTVFDAGVTDGDRPFLVMEHLAQGTLAQRIADGGRVDVHEIARIALSIISALATAHRRGVLHLDVKPANIMLGDEGAPVLGDFGVARLEVGGTIGTGGVPFSPFYAAPEVLDGRQPTRATDVYGLGATLFTMMAGRPPFWSEDDNQPSAVIARTLRGDLPDLSNCGVPIELITVVESMLDRRAEARPTLDEVARRVAALTASSSSPIVASSRTAVPAAVISPFVAPSRAGSVEPPVRSKRRLGPGFGVVAAIAIAAAAAVAVAVATLSAPSGRPTLSSAATTVNGRVDNTATTLDQVSASTTGTTGGVTDAEFPVIAGARWTAARDSTLPAELIARSGGAVADASARTLMRDGVARALVLRIGLAPSAGVVDDATFNDRVVSRFSPTSTSVNVASTVVHRVAQADGSAVTMFRAPGGEAWFVVAPTEAFVDAETAALVTAVGG